MLGQQRLLLTGIATEDSIATATLRQALEFGAQVICTAFPRDLEGARAVVAGIDPSVEVLGLDLCDPMGVEACRASIIERLGGLDGALHAVAFAPARALAAPMSVAEPQDLELSFRTSVQSFSVLANLVADLAPPSGGAVVGLDFDGGGAFSVYNWMGVMKAALRELTTYLARDLGDRRVRVNLVAAGPLLTRAARHIPDFDVLLNAWATTAPLEWDAGDPSPVADAICFLLSPFARAITGEVLHVDGGFGAMAGPLPRG